MLNVEKLLKDNRQGTINVFTTGEQLYCIKVDYNDHILPFFDAAGVDMKDCESCIFKEGTNLCSDEFLSWLFREYKEMPKLSKADYYFLKFLAENKGMNGLISIHIVGYDEHVFKQFKFINNDKTQYFVLDDNFKYLVPNVEYKISDLINKYEADDKIER